MQDYPSSNIGNKEMPFGIFAFVLLLSVLFGGCLYIKENTVLRKEWIPTYTSTIPDFSRPVYNGDMWTYPYTEDVIIPGHYENVRRWK